MKYFYNDCEINIYHKKATYEARIKCFPNDDGSITNLYAYAKTNKEAKEKAKRKIDAFIVKREKERVDALSKYTLLRYMNAFIRNDRDRRKSTTQRYNDTVKAISKDDYLMTFVSMPVNTISRKKLEEVVDTLCESKCESTLKKHLTLISNAFDLAVDDEIIRRNLYKIAYKKNPKSKVFSKKIESFSESEQKEFLKVLQKYISDLSAGAKVTAVHQSAVILALEYYTGVRPGEAVTIKNDDIDFDKHSLKIERTQTRGENYENAIGEPKTESGKRTVYLIPVIEEILKIYMHQYEQTKHHAAANDNLSDFVFLALRTGTMVRVTTVNNNFHQLFNDVFSGKYICEYRLRHTFATNCYRYGVRDNTISSLLGHKKDGITNQVYIDVFLKTIKEEIDKMVQKMKKDGLIISTENNNNNTNDDELNTN